MKTVIEMAREAGIRNCTCNGTKGCLDRFASLVRADERARMAEQPAQPQQEPVAIALNTGTKQGVKWLKNVEHGEGLYTTPQPAQRKPLTDAQINAFFEGMEPNNGFWLSFARAIEAAHGIKENT